jgi:beta propeller domain-containing protein
MKRALAAALLGAACMTGNDLPTGSTLEALGSCADVEAALRESAIREMEERLDESLRTALLYGCRRWGGLDDVAASGVPGGPLPPSAGGGGRASQVSTTNNQVAGVDEADFVKNDDKYIYIVTGATFRILDAWPPAQAHVVAEVGIEGEGHDLFVDGDRALIYSALGSAGGGRPCSYGFFCSFTGDGRDTKLTVLDIRDRGAPRVRRELWLSGSYLAARRIDDAVHTVVSSPGVVFPGLEYWPTDVDLCAGPTSPLEIELAFDRLRAANRAKILQAPLGDWLPVVSERIAGGERHTGLLGDCAGFYAASQGDGTALTTVMSLRMQDESAARFATVVSQPGAVYASRDALYVAVPQRLDLYGARAPARSGTDLHKFDLRAHPGAAAYVASGAVKGRVLYQFSMDEDGGYFRVATTSGQTPDPAVHSTVTVLEQAGATLRPVGALDDLARGEDIRAVRFAGDRGFVVTFKKTDPLFLLDLGDPRRPRILSEVKVPGFSTYMQLMDRGHLLTIGYDADDQGTFAWFAGVQLQIFDVTRPEAPALAHRELIGTRGSSSEALTNHLAFNYFAPESLLALPMTICEGGAGGSYGTDMTFSGLLVYDTTAAGGFHLRGRVPHPPSPGIGCTNWWTDARSQVQRSIIMDDTVFSVSRGLIKASRLDDLATDIAVIPLE